MRKVVLYARAFGLVVKRRVERRRERRQAERENQIVKWGNEERKKETAYFYYALGGVAIGAFICSGIVFSRTVNRMQDLHAMGVTEEETMPAVHDPVRIKEVEPEEISVQTQQVEIEEDEIPLVASFLEEDAFEALSLEQVTDVSALASSVLISGKDKSYDAQNLLDGDASTNWQEGEEGYGEGTVLTFTFDEPVTLSGIAIMNGNGISKEKYFANSRPGEITMKVGTGRVKYALDDKFGKQFIKLSDCEEIKELTITIDSVYKGDRYEDTCISDISFFQK